MISVVVDPDDTSHVWYFCRGRPHLTQERSYRGQSPDPTAPRKTLLHRLLTGPKTEEGGRAIAVVSRLHPFIHAVVLFSRGVEGEGSKGGEV